MSNVLVHSGRGLQHFMRPVRTLNPVRREKQTSASTIGTRSMIKFPSLVDRMQLQQERRQAAKMRLMLSNMLTRSYYKKKFTLEHAWRELRYDQKWCGNEGGNKRRKLGDGSHSGSESLNAHVDVDDDGTNRPPGVKAAKARGKKKPMVEGKEVSDFQTMLIGVTCSIGVTRHCHGLSCFTSCSVTECCSVFETPTYPGNFFRRRFRMNKLLFMRIVDRLSKEVQYFREKRDGLGRISLSPLQKCTAAIRFLAYGYAGDMVDEYLRLGETTTRLCVEKFVEGIINLFGDEYLRRPTPADLRRLLAVGEYRGFPGMIGSIDCTLNDINVLDRSPVFHDIIQGHAPKVTFSINGRQYDMAYYLTDDVERAFGVLQARFAIVKNPALFWDKVKIGKIMRACIILHNMIVEDERDGYTQYNLPEFIQGEENVSSHVESDFDRENRNGVANTMDARARIRDKPMHQQLKHDLVEHIWRQFGDDDDKN
uniref:DDE Tnp4 domain-containing protein n=1 Tax=Brassica oleracea var. oleracea TaxID=109376 RepID=A0A0D3E2G5_BRAOL